jgi:hypothetical protein
MTLRKRPSFGMGWQIIRLIFISEKPKYFLQAGLDRANQLDPPQQIRRCAQLERTSYGSQNSPVGQISRPVYCSSQDGLEPKA